MQDNGILDTYEPASCFDKVKEGRGRPHLELNEVGKRVIVALAQVMCTEEEIAVCIGTTVETLHNKWNEPIFLECYKKGFSEGKMSLRRSQFQLAKVNPTMAIFLGKQYLGQSEAKNDGSDTKKAALDQLCDAIRIAGEAYGK